MIKCDTVLELMCNLTILYFVISLMLIKILHQGLKENEGCVQNSRTVYIVCLHRTF